MDKSTLERINNWKNQSNLVSYLKEELNNLKEDELNDAFYKDLEFGTGGMRGVIGVGTNRMNIYTLRSANYGYSMYLLRSKGERSVVIAYDCRRRSLEFAKESARVLAKYNIKVYLFDKITPTPELSFAVRFLHATGGIVVTASHNPPQYNGYKIYDDTGCQLVPDKAEIVIDEIKNAPDPFTMELEDFDDLVKSGKVEIVGEKIDKAYLECVKGIQVHPELDKDNFRVAFTSLHGTSAYLGQRLLNELGYTFTPVKEQMVADSEFSTVKSPNPEDPRAFDLAISYAKSDKCDIIIATDPDADRVGLAVRDKDGSYKLLTGNQTGALLIYYLCNNRKVDKKGVVFNTIVTSPLGVEIAKSFGMESFSTLTGFKYIGEQATLLENSKDKMFYFGYEESYGYVVKDFVRDKDSLQALLLCSEMANFYKKNGKDLLEVLDEIYQKYGYYKEDLVNIALAGEEGAKKIERILDYFRSVNDFYNDDFKVVRKEDYLLRVSKDYLNKKEEKITLPVSNVIKYFLSDGSWFVLRPSGTEPKMKVYISSVSKNKCCSEKRTNDIKEFVLKIVNDIE